MNRRQKMLVVEKAFVAAKGDSLLALALVLDLIRDGIITANGRGLHWA